jgi:hypothetical protein
MRYIIYCDESDDKGKFYSNFYGGAILRASDRQAIEDELNAVKADRDLRGELKWTKISAYNEESYRLVIDKIFDFIEAGLLKIRIMFTQNINKPRRLEEYQIGNEYFLLYYQFIKHAFGLRFCNPERATMVSVSVYLDDVPDTREKLDNFKNYLSGLSDFPVFHRNRVSIPKSEITDVKSDDHVILQAVDIILGSMQFRLNDLHKAKPEGSRVRGKRTRAKERVYRHVNGRIRRIYPNFNIGTSTGQADGPSSKWLHPYRHWCFVPADLVQDRGQGKRADFKDD